MTDKSGNQKNQSLRLELALLRSRYDYGAVSPALYAVIRMLEIDIAWTEHQQVRS
jgi:hypothetical protein